MKLVMSDIHGNLEALTAVINDAFNNFKISQIFVLGDLVDYGADNCKVIDLLLNLSENFRISTIKIIKGNHDDAVLKRDCSRFRTDHGRQSFEKTCNELPENSKLYEDLESLTCLDHLQILDDYHNRIEFVHGTSEDFLWGNIGQVVPFNEDEKYVVINKSIRRDLVFCGHSHIQGFKPDGKSTITFNPGSVGQPRNGDPRAQYLLVEEDWSAVYPRAVEYDIDKAAQKIIDSGRPSFLATRLYLGI